jgi:ribosomal protein S18 acetylase RimI-like enzyme
MEIVAMSNDMVPQVRNLLRQVFSEPPWQTEDEQDQYDQDLVSDPTMVWYVAVEHGRLAGFIGGYVGPPEEVADKFDVPREFVCGTKIGYKALFGVSPEFRGRRVGQILTSALLDFFETEQIDQFLVATLPGTNNYGRYADSLATLGTCPNGMTYFGHSGGTPSNI